MKPHPYKREERRNPIYTAVRRALRGNRRVCAAGLVAMSLGTGIPAAMGASPFPAEFDLSSLDGTNGVVLKGIDASDHSGSFVSGAGDVNGDGFDDLIIGAAGADRDGELNAGESYVLFGTADGIPANFRLSNLDGSNGFVLKGIDTNDRSGHAVSDAGDVNGDGFGDLIIGAPNADPGGRNAAGESYVVFGAASGFPAEIDLGALDGSNGFVLRGVDSSDLSGDSVSGAGDVNGDGIDDILIGAPNADQGLRITAGETYVVFGAAEGFPAEFELSSLDGANGLILKGISFGDHSGGSVSDAGDVNGDGFDDILIGARLADPDGKYWAGESYLVFGAAGSFPAEFELSRLNGSNGFVLKGVHDGEYLSGDWSGKSVSGAGDVNGDGFDDLLIGAPGAKTDAGVRAGESYLVFGAAGGFPAEFELSNLDGNNGVVLEGFSGESGYSVSGAGDVNGDGFDDILIGAWAVSPDGKIVAGESYVVFGAPGEFPARVPLVALDGASGFALKGVSAYDSSGDAVSGVGDINGDGLDDILIGAPTANPDGKDAAGESYVLFGATCDVDGNGRFGLGDALEFALQCRGDSMSRWCDLDGNGRFGPTDVLALARRCSSGSAPADNIVEEALRTLNAR